MKVWIVWADNGRSYADHCWWIAHIHESETGANTAKIALEVKLRDRDPQHLDKTTYAVVEYEVLP